MESILFALDKVAPVFCVMIAGYILRCVKVIKVPLAEDITSLAFKTFLPVNIFNTIITAGFVQGELKLILFLTVFLTFYIAALWIAIVRIEKDPARCAIFIQSSFRGNTLLIGMPIVINLYGAEGALPAVVMLIAEIIYYNVGSVFLLNTFHAMSRKAQGGRKDQLKKIAADTVKHPLIIASALGLAWNVSGLVMPGPVMETISGLADIATPLTLIALGATLNVKRIMTDIRMLFSIVSLKLVVSPIAAILLARLMGFNSYEMAAVISTFAVPTGIASFMMALDKNMEPELAGESVVLTTFFSIFTLTGIIAGLHVLGWLV